VWVCPKKAIETLLSSLLTYFRGSLVGSKIFLFMLGSKILLFLLSRHKLLLGTRENMAIIYEQQGHYDQALKIYKPGLETKIRVCGQDSLDVAASFNGLGHVYRSLGKYQEALEMHKKSLDIKTRILGGDSHPDVAKSYGSLGNV